MTTIRDRFRSPRAVFSTGPSLTIARKTTDNWIELLGMSYTSSDQGRMNAKNALFAVRKLLLITYWLMSDTNIGRGCGGKMFSMDGTIMSPMYPMVYNKTSTCRWDLAVPRPNPITIIFKGVYRNIF